MSVLPLLGILDMQLRSRGNTYLVLPEEKEHSSCIRIEAQNRISHITVSDETPLLCQPAALSLFVNTTPICFPKEL